MPALIYSQLPLPPNQAHFPSLNPHISLQRKCKYITVDAGNLYFFSLRANLFLLSFPAKIPSETARWGGGF